jgi:hypothetical protein
MDTFEKARISDAITRAEMAKMISVFATKILHKIPDTEKIKCSQFTDLSTTTKELQAYSITSCQLGLMGMDGDGIGVQEAFFPTRTITRAEAGTLLSRLLWGNLYAADEQHWYEKHLEALREANIMKLITTPMRLDLRGNIFIMLMRMES